MLVFKDRKVIDALCKALITASRIGEHINIVSGASNLQLLTTNSSVTVVAETTISARLFEGNALINTHVKARSAEVVARVISRSPVKTVEWEFVSTNEDVLCVHVSYNTGAHKSFTIPCLHIVSSRVDFVSPTEHAYSFSCLTDRLRDAFSHCDLGADEIKLVFYYEMIKIYARKIYRGNNGSNSIGDTAVNGSDTRGLSGQGLHPKKVTKGSGSSTGLSTTVTLQPETFEQISMQTPLQLVFKFKEFRTVVKALHSLSEKVVLQVRFDAEPQNTTTVLEFRVTSPVSPPFQYLFRFLAKQSSDLPEAPRWLNIGRQILPHEMSIQNLFVDEENESMTVEENAVIEQPQDSTESTREPDNSVPTPDNDDYDNDLDEIGYTQGGPTTARGLFD